MDMDGEGSHARRFLTLENRPVQHQFHLERAAEGVLDSLAL